MKRWAWRLGVASLAGGALTFAVILVLWLIYPFPIERLERWPASPRITDRTGGEMLCLVGSDEQWRLPVPLGRMSPWLVQATIAVEDERFRSHPGVDPIAVLRASWQNATSLRIVSGASTITMQVCRMMDDRPRTLSAKLAEAFRAMQLESLRGKDRIIETYLNIAPYGRNYRGIEAAARGWFGKSCDRLSLGEAALLAGLPQSPSRLRPDCNPEGARARRRIVLARMTELGMIGAEQQRIAEAEPVVLSATPSRPVAPHAAFLARARREREVRTTIDPVVQGELERLTAEYARALPAGSDLAAVVVDIPSGNVVAMIGSADADDPVDGQVNGVIARRSPGSALKPFIYAAAFESRRLAPESTVYDIPIERTGWSPSNFDDQFNGPLTAAEALRRSLNVPAILVAEQVGLPRCLGVIESAGIDLPDDVLSRGGLAVVVGAIEVRLLDLVNGYATIGREGIRNVPRLFLDDAVVKAPALDRNVCAALDDVLSCRRRAPAGLEQVRPEDLAWFMWKTGTSSGRRDAWAVGHNRRYAVGVWVGRFSGAGRLEFVGAEIAEPLLARLFQSPLLRAAGDPVPPAGWAVVHPLKPPAELAQPLQILSPRSGSSFVAVGGTAVIHPTVNRPEGTTWFLNGKLLSPNPSPRLILPPGRHEIRCVNSYGITSYVTFDVQ